MFDNISRKNLYLLAAVLSLVTFFGAAIGAWVSETKIEVVRIETTRIVEIVATPTPTQIVPPTFTRMPDTVILTPMPTPQPVELEVGGVYTITAVGWHSNKFRIYALAGPGIDYNYNYTLDAENVNLGNCRNITCDEFMKLYDAKGPFTYLGIQNGKKTFQYIEPTFVEARIISTETITISVANWNNKHFDIHSDGSKNKEGLTDYSFATCYGTSDPNQNPDCTFASFWGPYGLNGMKFTVITATGRVWFGTADQDGDGFSDHCWTNEVNETDGTCEWRDSVYVDGVRYNEPTQVKQEPKVVPTATTVTIAQQPVTIKESDPSRVNYLAVGIEDLDIQNDQLLVNGRGSFPLATCSENDSDVLSQQLDKGMGRVRVWIWGGFSHTIESESGQLIWSACGDWNPPTN